MKNGTNGHVVDATGDHGPKKGDFTCDEKLQSKIVRQVEHYFGDYNLPRDKFLKETIQSDEGWVSMDVMMKFQRLAGLSEDPQVTLYLDSIEIDLIGLIPHSFNYKQFKKTSNLFELGNYVSIKERWKWFNGSRRRKKQNSQMSNLTIA